MELTAVTKRSASMAATEPASLCMSAPILEDLEGEVSAGAWSLYLSTKTRKRA